MTTHTQIPIPWPISTMPLLGANGTEAMAALLLDGESNFVDYLKVGPFQGRDAIVDLGQRHPLLLHLDDTLGGEPLSIACVREIRDLVSLTGTPWISEHIAYGVPGIDLGNALAPQPRSQLMSREQTLANIVRNANQLAQRLSIPLLLENIPFFPNLAHMHVCEPDFIHEVIERTGCGLLLDLAHARVSAAALGYDVYDYICKLPLDQVVELHLSGPRRVYECSSRLQELVWQSAPTLSDLVVFDEQKLVDAHEPMQEPDWALLDWVLAHAQPRAISLEYYRDPLALRAQLLRLGQMLERDM